MSIEFIIMMMMCSSSSIGIQWIDVQVAVRTCTIVSHALIIGVPGPPKVVLSPALDDDGIMSSDFLRARGCPHQAILGNQQRERHQVGGGGRGVVSSSILLWFQSESGGRDIRGGQGTIIGIGIGIAIRHFSISRRIRLQHVLFQVVLSLMLEGF
jgi:hypothetical protein